MSTDNNIVANVEVAPTVAEKKKICIVGFAPSWKDAPFADQTWEMWLINEMYSLAPQLPSMRADKWFEIHDMMTPSKHKPEHISALANMPCPVYTQKKYDFLPNATVFPLDEIIEWMAKKGYNGSKYFTNSIAYFIMYAAFLGAEEIAIYGVDMSTDSEYSHQKPSCEYMIGLCEGMGIKVTIPESSELLKCNQLYAYQSSNKLRVWVKKQKEELAKRTQQYAMQQEQAHKAAHQAEIAQAEIRGANQAYSEWLKRSQ